MQGLLKEWNNTVREYPTACVHQLFEQQVEKTPHAVAVVYAGQQLSYQELNARANQLAAYLQTLGVGPEVFVGICMERSLDLIVGLLGVLKAGGCYIPLDPTYPTERLDYMLEDSDAQVLVTNTLIKNQLSLSARQQQLRTVCIDSDWETIATHSQQNPISNIQANHLIYTIYTSGSTGKPKGVQIIHKGVVNLLHSLMQSPGISPEDTLLAVTTVSFDMAVVEIFLPLMVGAKLHLAHSEVVSSGTLLKQLIKDSGASIVQATPASWYLLLAANWEGNKDLSIFCGGEAMTPALADQLLEKGGTVWNMYGPTEITVYATIYNVGLGRQLQDPSIETAKASEPIGQPIDNTQVFILDENLAPVEIGEKGELHIGGDGLARNYRNLPALTAEKFIPNPFGKGRLYKTGDLTRFRPDGLIDYLGRIDHQVKIHGFRVELGEIEAVLGRHSTVHRTAVLFRASDGLSDIHRRLVAYVVPNSNTESNQGQPFSHQLEPDLRTFLKTQLPEYMLPSAYVFLEEMPLTPNGKINRKVLPAPDKSRPDLVTSLILPKTDTEKKLAKIWREVIQLDVVGIHDNFFELGGSSLLLNQVQLEVAKAFSSDLTTVTLFQYPTIHTLAQYLRPPVNVSILTKIGVETKGRTTRKRGKNSVAALRERRKSHRR